MSTLQDEAYTQHVTPPQIESDLEEVNPVA